MIDQETAGVDGFAVGDTIRVSAQGPIARVPHLRDRGLRRRLDRSAAPPSPSGTCPTARRCSGSTASTRSRSRRRTASRTAARLDAARVRAGDRRGADRRRAGAEDKQGIDAFIAFIRGFLLAFGGIALFVGALRHLQHALDHDRAARAGAGDAADARRLAAAGAPLRPARGGRDRRSSHRSLGIAVGIGLAKGLTEVFAAARPELPQSDPVLRDRGRSWSRSLVGVGVTLSPASPGAAGDARRPDRGRARRRDAAAAPDADRARSSAQ